MKRAGRRTPNKSTLINEDDVNIDHYDAKAGSSSVFCFLPTVLILSSLLLTTLYMLRLDKIQLTKADGYIEDLKLQIESLDQEVAGHQLQAKLVGLEHPMLATVTLPCSVDLPTVKKQVETWQVTAQESLQLVEDVKRKCSNSEREIATMQAAKQELSTKILAMSREKRLLAKRVGIKMATERLNP